MRRMSLAAILCALICMLAGPAIPESLIGKIVGKYEKAAYRPGVDVKKCAALLRAELMRPPVPAGGSLIPEATSRTNFAMASAGCFDFYTGLSYQPRAHQTASLGTIVPDPQRQEPKVVFTQGTHLVFRIKEFSQATRDQLDRQFESLEKDWRTKSPVLLLDLRGDAGGVVEYLQKILDSYFAPQVGVRFMQSVVGWKPGSETTKYKGFFAGMRLVILIDRNTASASEWMTATLKYWYPNATIVGERSFGKGLIQTIYDLDSGFTFKLTTGTWTVNGKSVQGNGIDPDVAMSFDDCPDDAALVAKLAKYKL